MPDDQRPLRSAWPERGLTLAKLLVELVVRVDDERLLESFEGMALGLEDFHGDGVGVQLILRA